jgi:hypothetical protein
MTFWLKFGLCSAFVVLPGCGSGDAHGPGESAAGSSVSGAGSGGATGSSGQSSGGGTGTAGSAGASGATGSAGTSGGAGASGSAGTTGSSGATGTAATGASGSGMTGSSGTAGSMRDGGTGTTRADGGSTARDAGPGTTSADGGTVACTITSQAVQSTAIPTVFTVTWSSSLANLTSAEIDFGPSSSGPTMVAPVDLSQPNYKTVLIGMKPSASYVYRVIARTSAGSCTGEDATIMTGALTNPPKPTVTISSASSHDKGFIITSSGIEGTSAYIMDADGTVVWAAPSTGVPSQPSRVHLSWDATKMYEMSLNVMNTGSGKIVLQPLDGSASTTLAGVAASHHDLAAIPGGLATPMWNKSGIDAPCSVVELTEAGAMTTVVADVGSTLYNSSTFHTNSIHYYARDNDYTIGDRNPNLYVKLSRTGDLIWQFGGANPKDPTKFFSGVTTWQVNHGHELTADGTFVFFNNNANEMWNYKLDESTMTATQVMHYTATGATSSVLGDAQVLPNGNILVTFSTGGQMHEITPSGTLVMKITAPSGQNFGYSEFRESLYGPPPY